MTSLNRKSLFKKLVTVAGIAGISSLIAVPGFAELNRQTHGFNQSGDRVFDLADNDLNDPTSPGPPVTDPNNNNNSGRSPNTPTSGETAPNSLSSRDKNFVLQAAQTGMLEVQLGKLAVERGSSARV